MALRLLWRLLHPVVGAGTSRGAGLLSSGAYAPAVAEDARAPGTHRWDAIFTLAGAVRAAAAAGGDAMLEGLLAARGARWRAGAARGRRGRRACGAAAGATTVGGGARHRTRRACAR